MRTRSLAVIASFAASLLAAPAFADVTYTWNTKSPGGSSYSGNGSQYTFTSNGETVKVRSYSLSGLTTSSTFQTSTVGIYDGGLGVTSNGESGSPNHAVDNVGRFDFLLFEFESADFTNFGFQIGWKSGDSDIEVWVGNAAAGLNLTNSGLCSGSCNYEDLDNMGFGPSQTFSNVALNTTQSVSGSLSGRYLLVSGRLTYDTDDYFKVSLINGTQPGQVPEPSSLALLAAAVAGVGFASRKRRAA
jgi:hypothetical protein